MKVVCIIQARMGSSRFPGKVIAPIREIPMIQLMLDRVKQAKTLDKIWVASSENPENDEFEKVVTAQGIDCFRGSEEDVLSRFVAIGEKEQADLIVRLTGDCPFMDPNMLDEMIDFAKENYESYHYFSNNAEPTYPDGLDIEICHYSALKEAHEITESPLDREHVTYYFAPGRSKKTEIKRYHFKNDRDLSHKRWTLDHHEDLELITHIFHHFWNRRTEFSWLEVLEYLEAHPELEKINQKYTRNESFEKQRALEKD